MHDFLHIAILGSGSDGNAIVVSNGERALMIDAGFSCREIMSRLARLSLAESYRKGTDYTASAGVYERMLKDGQGSVEVLVKLAILYEHRLKRPEEALRLTRRAILLCEDEEQLEQLNRRYQRLTRKTERME